VWLGLGTCFRGMGVLMYNSVCLHGLFALAQSSMVAAACVGVVLAADSCNFPDGCLLGVWSALLPTYLCSFGYSHGMLPC